MWCAEQRQHVWGLASLHCRMLWLQSCITQSQGDCLFKKFLPMNCWPEYTIHLLKNKKKINTEDTPSPRKLFSVNSCCLHSVQRDKVQLRALGTTEGLQGLSRSGWLMSTCWLCWLRLMPGASPAHLQQIPVAALLGSRAKTKEWEYHSSPCPTLLQELPWDHRFQGLGGIWRIPNLLPPAQAGRCHCFRMGYDEYFS